MKNFRKEDTFYNIHLCNYYVLDVLINFSLSGSCFDRFCFSEMNKEADVIEQIKEKVYLSNYNFPHKLKMF